MWCGRNGGDRTIIGGCTGKRCQRPCREIYNDRNLWIDGVRAVVGVDIVAGRFGFGGTAAAVGGAVAVVVEHGVVAVVEWLAVHWWRNWDIVERDIHYYHCWRTDRGAAVEPVVGHVVVVVPVVGIAVVAVGDDLVDVVGAEPVVAV